MRINKAPILMKLAGRQLPPLEHGPRNPLLKGLARPLKRPCCLLVVLLLAPAVLAFGQTGSAGPAGVGTEPAVPDKPRIAVFQFDVRGDLGIPDAGAIIAEWMIGSLAATQRFTLTERVLLSKVLEEQELQTSYLADESTMAAEAGRLYGVEAIVSGTVLEWGETISIVARLVDTSTGVIRATAQVKTRSRESIPDKIDLLAQKLAGPTSVPAVPLAETEEAEPTDQQTDSPAPKSASPITQPAWLSIRILPQSQLALGDEMRLEVTSEQPGRLLVVDIDPSGNLSQIYPYPCTEPCRDDRLLEQGERLVIPSPFDGIRFAAREPIGDGRVMAILSDTELKVDDLRIDRAPTPANEADHAANGTSAIRVQLAPTSTAIQQGSHVWAAEAPYAIRR